MADKNPGAAQRIFEANPQAYDKVDGVEVHRMFDFMQRRDRQEQMAMRADQRFQQEDNDRNWQIKFFQTGTLNDAGGFTPQPGFISNAIRSGAGPAAIRSMLDFADRAAAPHSTPGFEHEMITGLISGRYTTADLLNAVGRTDGPSLSKSDAIGIMTLTNGMDSDEKRLMAGLQNEAKANLAPARDILGNVDPVGAHNLSKFTAWEMDALKTGLAQGKTRGQLLDPRSPDYILKNVPWSYFQGSMTDAVNDAIQNEGPNPAANRTLAQLAGAVPPPSGDQAHRDSFVERIMRFGEHSQPGATAVSPAGATGEMQVMPRTAANPGMGIRPSDGTPADTARVGREYATALWDKYSGGSVAAREVLASAAYNAGPAQVDAWLKTIGDPRSGAITPQEFINRIPLAETRAYAQRVTGIGGANEPLTGEQLRERLRTMTPAERARYFLFGPGAGSAPSPP
jgi:hypothetical protein